MTKYIEREAFEKALCDERDKIPRDAKDRYLNGKRDAFNEVHSLMLGVPLSEAATVRHGRWEQFRFGPDDYALRLRCSNCKFVVYERDFRYCPICGSRMDLGGADE